jgi:hypothetical protein
VEGTYHDALVLCCTFVERVAKKKKVYLRRNCVAKVNSKNAWSSTSLSFFFFERNLMGPFSDGLVDQLVYQSLMMM